MTVWRCKRCREWGIGGPDGFVKHEHKAHTYDVRLGSSLSFGFAPNYGDGWRTNHWTDYRPQPRCEVRPE